MADQELCQCGCGEYTGSRARFCPGHRQSMSDDTIRPAGMTVERALEIAIAVLEARGDLRPAGEEVVAQHEQRVVRKADRGLRVSSSRTVWTRLNDETRDRILSLTRQGKSAVEIALLVGIASRTVTRIRAKNKLEQLQKEAS